MANLIFAFVLQLGMLSGAGYKYEALHEYQKYVIDIPIYASMELNTSYGILHGFARWRTEFWKETCDIDFLPTQMSYVIGGEIHIRPFTIGISHTCFHPIKPYSIVNTALDQIIPPTEGAFDDFYFRVELQF